MLRPMPHAPHPSGELMSCNYNTTLIKRVCLKRYRSKLFQTCVSYYDVRYVYQHDITRRQSGRTMAPHSDAATQAGRQTDVQRSDIINYLSIMTL